MKKYLLTSMLLILGILFVAGCGSNDASGNESANSNSNEESQASEGDKIVLKVVHDVADDHIKGIGANLIKERVEERLGDKVEVEVYPNSSLFEVEEGMEALQAGNVHIVAGATSKLVGYDPSFQLIDMPFLFGSNDEITGFINEPAGQDLLARVEEYDLKVLDLWVGAFKQITNNKHPITKPEDMEGIKVRVMAGGLLEDQYTQLGAGATIIPFGELYMALQQGVIDGQENTFIEIATSNLHEVQKYMTITNHAPATYPIVTNKTFWEGLPDDIRTELDEIIAEITLEVANMAADVAQENYEVIADSDIEITELSDSEREAFRTALQPLYEKYSDVIGEDLINAALEYTK